MVLALQPVLIRHISLEGGNMKQSTILLVISDKQVQTQLSDHLAAEGYLMIEMVSGGGVADVLRSQPVDMLISDAELMIEKQPILAWLQHAHYNLPSLLISPTGSVRQAIAALKMGASDYFSTPLELDQIMTSVKQYMPQYCHNSDVVAVDSMTQSLLNLVSRVAATDVAVMIHGPSGVGKEVIAKQIHLSSPKSEGPFVAINCAAIPENMLEATLFGYEKGAFTGAYQSMPGKFEQAEGGTLLLDEISEMDLGLQAKLLRVLQEKEVERLGGRKTISLDVRIVATTNRRLQDEVSAGRFREDLYYRLNVFPLSVKPLAERANDIIPLAEFFLRKYYQAGGLLPYFSQCAKKSLECYSWPGNVRELENVIQRALILCLGDQITAESLQFEESLVASTVSESEQSCLSDGLQSTEAQMIVDVLKTKNITRKEAAEQLGISQRTLRYKLAKMRDCGVAIPG